MTSRASAMSRAGSHPKDEAAGARTIGAEPRDLQRRSVDFRFRRTGAVRLFIFDIDGTLVDSQHQIVEAQARAFAAHDLPAPTRAASLAVVGLSLHEAFAALVGADGPLDSLARAYKDAWGDLVAHPSYSETLYPGALETIAALAARDDVVLGIATGKSRRGVDRILTAFDWHHLFATVQTADDHPSKPDPAMLNQALTESGLTACDATMIGDTTYDMAMAVAAGVRPIGVAWGFHAPDMLRTAGATVVVESFDALRTVLDATDKKTAERHE